MPYHVNRDHITPGTKTTINDLQVVTEEGSNVADIKSAGGNLPVVVEGDYMFLTGSVGNENRSTWLVLANPTTFLIVAEKIGCCPEDHGPQAGGQVWHSGRVYRNGPGNFPPNETELAFEDVALMNLKTNVPPGVGGGGED